jgi:transglycosylase-like protein with SLT domain
VFRSIAAIALAIRFGHPDVSEADANRYAVALQAEAERNQFDPLTGVAIIHRESRFHPRAASPDGEDFGLAQVRARYIGACKKDKDPKRRPSAACKAVKESLLEPEENIRVMSELIAGHRKLCMQKVGKAIAPGWLASYQGSNSAKENRWCSPSEGAWTVIKYRDRLAREVTLRAKEIEAADKALAQQAQERAEVADVREDAPPEPAEDKAAAPRGG